MTSNSKLERMDFWRPHFAAHKSSGLSRAAYCKQHDLIVAQFAYYKKRLAAQQPSTKLFFPVKLSESPNSVRITFPSGVAIDCPSNTDPQWLAAIALGMAGT